MRYKGYKREGKSVYSRDMSSSKWELYASFDSEETAQAFLERKVRS